MSRPNRHRIAGVAAAVTAALFFSTAVIAAPPGTKPPRPQAPTAELQVLPCAAVRAGHRHGPRPEVRRAAARDICVQHAPQTAFQAVSYRGPKGKRPFRHD